MRHQVPDLTAVQRELFGSLDARFAAALCPVVVKPSLVMEIGWALSTYFGLIRLFHRAGLAHKVYQALEHAPELAKAD